jgi:hypothetical protein
VGFEGDLKGDIVKKQAQDLKNGFNKSNQSQIIKILHCCTCRLKGQIVCMGEKECSTTFVLEVIWDPVKAFPDE